MVRKHSSDEELEQIGLLQEKQNVQFFDKKGNPCEEHSAVARATGSLYAIKYRRGELFDPYGVDEMKSTARDTIYKKVDQSVFDQYIKYLKTRRVAYLLDARREFMRKGF
jgi:hypothetical protein